jgi:hypothetical protein
VRRERQRGDDTDGHPARELGFECRDDEGHHGLVRLHAVELQLSMDVLGDAGRQLHIHFIVRHGPILPGTWPGAKVSIADQTQVIARLVEGLVAEIKSRPT